VPAPSFIERFILAWITSFRVLFNATYAARVRGLSLGEDATDAPPKSLPIADPALPKSVPQAAPPSELNERALVDARREGALIVLGGLQRDGRFIDFLQQDVDAFSDAEIGTAARVVHAGCKKRIASMMTFSALREEEEGARVSVDPSIDAGVKLVGNVRGNPPFSGVLLHRGWRASEVKVSAPVKGHDTTILGEAEVEL
jgi:hypothetical protein